MPPAKKSPTMRQKIETALTLSKVLTVPVKSGNTQRRIELNTITRDLNCFSKTIITGTRYDVVLIDSTREMELI